MSGTLVPPLPALTRPHKDGENDFFFGMGTIPARQLNSPENAPSPGYSPSLRVVHVHPKPRFLPPAIYRVPKQNSPSHAAPSQAPQGRAPSRLGLAKTAGAYV